MIIFIIISLYPLHLVQGYKELLTMGSEKPDAAGG